MVSSNSLGTRLVIVFWLTASALVNNDFAVWISFRFSGQYRWKFHKSISLPWLTCQALKRWSFVFHCERLQGFSPKTWQAFIKKKISILFFIHVWDKKISSEISGLLFYYIGPLFNNSFVWTTVFFIQQQLWKQLRNKFDFWVTCKNAEWFWKLIGILTLH